MGSGGQQESLPRIVLRDGYWTLLRDRLGGTNLPSGTLNGVPNLKVCDQTTPTCFPGSGRAPVQFVRRSQAPDDLSDQRRLGRPKLYSRRQRRSGTYESGDFGRYNT